MGAGHVAVGEADATVGLPRAPAPYPDPLEPKREVCELNPDCDELADQVGLQDAYQRFYGPV